jgi:hypothetical protein
MKLCHLPYQRTTEILNDDVPVKTSANGTVRSPLHPSSHSTQEISSDAASQLLELIDQEHEETIDSQKEKLLAYETNLSAILSEQFELPLEEDPAPPPASDSGADIERDTQPTSGAENGHSSTMNETHVSSSHGPSGEAPKRRGRSRSRSGGDRGDNRRNKTGGSYLDLFDIVNMTYEEYLESYRSASLPPAPQSLLPLPQAASDARSRGVPHGSATPTAARPSHGWWWHGHGSPAGDDVAPHAAPGPPLRASSRPLLRPPTPPSPGHGSASAHDDGWPSAPPRWAHGRRWRQRRVPRSQRLLVARDREGGARGGRRSLNLKPLSDSLPLQAAAAVLNKEPSSSRQAPARRAL